MRNRLAVAAVAVAMVAVACGGGDDSGDTTIASAEETQTTSASEPTPTTAGEMTTTTAGEETPTTAAEMTDGIHTADTDLGTILVDADGFTLYIFTNDTDGTSTCYDGCAVTWPPVPGDSDISSELDSAIFGTAARDDGTDQLTVNGMPLYRYTPDAAPGDTNGQGVNGVWFVVDAAGSVVEAADAGNVPVIDYSY